MTLLDRPHADDVAIVPRARTLPDSVGGWRAVRWIANGAWTEVYQATPSAQPTDSPADYALKMLRPSRECDWLAIHALANEIRVGRRVSHPHLISILGGQVSQAPHFLVMPFLEGRTASDLIADHGCMPVTHALWIARQTAEALQALHSASWTHGDVKPANILVSRNGHATLLDLGLARPLGDADRSHRAVMAGTPAYVAPETLIEDRCVDAASDVYSLGICLFEFLTGRRPFDESSSDAMAAAHLHIPAPDPRNWAPQVPLPVAHLLRRVLSKEPLRRPSPGELVAELVEQEVETFGEHLSENSAA